MTDSAAPQVPQPLQDENPFEGSAIEGLIGRLQQKVAERKASGEYPEGLIDELDEHFQRIVFHRVDHDASYLFSQLTALDSSSSFNPGTIETSSSVPGGSQIHSILARAQARQTEGILQQVQRYADDVRTILNSLVLAVQDGSTHVHSDLVARIDAILERLDSYERAPSDSPKAVADLRRRVEQLEKAEANRGFRPFFTNDAFENHFRGSADDLSSRYEDLADQLGLMSGPVVDFGCGRGEFLELLRKREVECWGIEIDPELARIAGEAELRVEVGDGIEILARLDDESLGGVALLQVIEHLSVQQQLDLVSTAYAKLKPGGRLIMETVNPQSLYVYAHSFYIDPTHTRPVHPLYLQFIQQEIGFSNVSIDWRGTVPAQDVMVPAVGDNEGTKANLTRLNNLLFGAPDYATIATK